MPEECLTGIGLLLVILLYKAVRFHRRAKTSEKQDRSEIEEQYRAVYDRS